jgi:hypothetical protein
MSLSGTGIWARALVAGAVGLVGSAAQAADYVGPLSHLEWQGSVSVAPEKLTCVAERGTGYAPIAYSYATLTLESGWNGPTLGGATATIYETGDTDLCEAVEALRASATDNSGYALADLVSDLKVQLSPRYGGGCDRELVELVSVKFSDRLKFEGGDMRVLSGGTQTGWNCRN